MAAILEELDLYPWTDHAVLLGNNRPLDGQDTAAILERFGNKATTACRNYRLYKSARRLSSRPRKFPDCIPGEE